MRKLLLGMAVCVATGAIFSAAAFWESKPFAAWSDKEVQQVLTDSPWSRRVQVVMNTLGPAGDIDARGGGDGDGGGGRGGRGGFPTAAPQLKLLVSWRSALPMKQAFVRVQSGPSGAVSAEQQQLLDRDEPQYVVEILGLPARFANAIGNMKDVTFLKRGNKPPLAVSEAAAQQTANGILLLFAFPKTDPITLDEKEVELVTKLGTFDVKRKFPLKDMVFRGKLEL